MQFERLSKVLSKLLALNEKELGQCFRLAKKNEIEQITVIRRNVFGGDIKEDDQEYLCWRYFSRIGYESTLWVFEYKGEIIASMGAEPVTIIQGENTISAARNMDAIVNPEYNNRGLGAWMALALQNKYDCTLISGGNKNSLSMIKKLYTSLAVRKNYKLIFNSSQYFQNKYNSKLALIVSPVFDLIMAAYLNIKWSKKRNIDNVEIKKINNISELIELIPDDPGCLGDVKVHRTKEYMTWRYLDNPRSIFTAYVAIEDSKLTAYVLYDFLKVSSHCDFNRGRIVDWNIYTKSNIENILAELFVNTTKCLKHSGADQISVVLNDAKSEKAINNVGFSLRGIDSRFFVNYKNSVKDDSIYSPDAWFQSMTDSDGV